MAEATPAKDGWCLQPVIDWLVHEGRLIADPAKLIAEIPGRGCRLDLHGLQLNITGIVASQSRKQLYGIEHIAVDTDDYAGTLAKLKANGVRILEEMPPNNNGRRVCFLEAPDGAQVEVIEKV